MTERILPREEYGRLVGTELESFAELLPLDANVLVVEDADGRIVGAWSAFWVLHLEGVWIAPEYRGRGSVARRLWLGMLEIARSMGAVVVKTSSQSAELSNLLRKRGAVQLEGEHFSLRVGL